MEKIDKRVSTAFCKTIYLLGVDINGQNVWLEEAQWQCGWYWGFGYIEQYTNNKNPGRSRDIISHSHFSGLLGNLEYFDSVKNCWLRESDYTYHINGNSTFRNTTLTDNEAWKLSDLMRTFYTLQKAAEVYTHGNSHWYDPGLSLKSSVEAKHINDRLLPQIFKAVYKLLEPKKR
jgi:hypothetical protein